MTSSVCHVICGNITDQKSFSLKSRKKADDVINQLFWSRRLPRESFNLIACLKPVKQDDHYFHAKILVFKFHLGPGKACLSTRRRFFHQSFLYKNFTEEILFTVTKFSAKPSRGYGVRDGGQGWCAPLRKQFAKS